MKILLDQMSNAQNLVLFENHVSQNLEFKSVGCSVISIVVQP